MTGGTVSDVREVAFLEPAAGDIAGLLDNLRSRTPKVHCITNSVAQNFTANVLLALGATPSMTIARDEVPAFVASADGLLINIGTMDAERRAAIDAAIEAAAEKSMRFVLDPVLVDRSPPRLALAKQCMAHHPAVIRANRGEFTALGAGGDAHDFARSTGITLALTGAVDLITDGTRAAECRSGHPLMARVTAMGCAASAIVAAFVAIEPDPLLAARAALTIMGIAGEQAGTSCKGPGSFASAFIDALYNCDASTLRGFRLPAFKEETP